MLNENSKISLVKNIKEAFYDQQPIDKTDLNSYSIPAENSLLGFDCFEEISLLKILLRNDKCIDEKIV